MKKLFLSCFAVLAFKNCFALEITNYKVDLTGMFHNVTVAFNDLDKKSVVRCVITKNNKPVAQKRQVIYGVGTVEIFLNGGANGTRASCSEMKK